MNCLRSLFVKRAKKNVQLEYSQSELHWMFSSPNQMGEVTLVIGDKKLVVYKKALTAHSPVFATMLSDKKEMAEVELENVEYEEFVALLFAIYGRLKLSDATTLPMLKIAHRFQMRSVLNVIENRFITTKTMKITEKLLMADQYGLNTLKEHCLQNYRTVRKVNSLVKSAVYAQFSEGMKLEIVDHHLKIIGLQEHKL